MTTKKKITASEKICKEINETFNEDFVAYEKHQKNHGRGRKRKFYFNSI